MTNSLDRVFGDGSATSGREKQYTAMNQRPEYNAINRNTQAQTCKYAHVFRNTVQRTEANTEGDRRLNEYTNTLNMQQRDMCRKKHTFSGVK